MYDQMIRIEHQARLDAYRDTSRDPQWAWPCEEDLPRPVALEGLRRKVHALIVAVLHLV